MNIEEFERFIEEDINNPANREEFERFIEEDINNPAIRVLYIDPEMPKLEKIDVGDWVDLRTAEDVEMKAGDYKLISLGVAIKMPVSYEALLVPRSSTFKKHGIIQSNSIGVIDSSFSGPDDVWMFPAIALRDTVIPKYTRIAQFRLFEHQPNLPIIEVTSDDMGKNRGGIGSTGEM